MTCIDRNRHADVTTRFCPECGERVHQEVLRIHHYTDIRKAAEILGVRPDWHEPDEQEVTAKVEGWTFDNAGFWPDDQCSDQILEGQGSEMCVKLFKEGRLIAVANLATLFAMAARTYS